jgi:hypothetical protein
LDLPKKILVTILQIIMVASVAAFGAMGVASVSASYIKDSLQAQTFPQRTVVHQVGSLQNGSPKIFSIPTLVPDTGQPARANNSFSGLPRSAVSGAQPQMTGTPEPTKTAEVDDDPAEQQVTKTPVIEFEDDEMTFQSDDNQPEQMSTAAFSEDDDEMSSSASSDEGSSHSSSSSSHSGHHHTGGGRGGD